MWFNREKTGPSREGIYEKDRFSFLATFTLILGRRHEDNTGTM
jgi:hypothetical protein